MADKIETNPVTGDTRLAPVKVKAPKAPKAPKAVKAVKAPKAPKAPKAVKAPKAPTRTGKLTEAQVERFIASYAASHELTETAARKAILHRGAQRLATLARWSEKSAS